MSKNVGMSQRKLSFSNDNEFGTRILSSMNATQWTAFLYPNPYYLVIIVYVKGAEPLLCNTLFLLKLRIFNRVK